jgi:hypothetical protein
MAFLGPATAQLRALRAEYFNSQHDCSDVGVNGLAASHLFLVCSHMSRRLQRTDMPPDRSAILDALGACRTATILGVQSKVRINRPVYVAANAVVTAIDALAALLTGDPQFFWDKDAPFESLKRHDNVICVSPNACRDRITLSLGLSIFENYFENTCVKRVHLFDDGDK